MSDQLTAEASVNYTVRELFDKQNEVLDKIDKKLDNKADKAEVVELRAHTEHLETRVDDLETRLTELTHTRAFARRMWAIIGSIAGICAVLLSGLITALVH